MQSIKSNLKPNNLKKISSKKMDADFANLVKRLELSDEEIAKNTSSLEDTVLELKNCANCPGLANCPNHIQGYVYYPSKNESKLTFNYVACKKLKKHEEDMKKKDSNNVILNARMKDIDVTDKNRVKLIKWLKAFYDNYNPAKNSKGLYLHGSFGGGKTFLLASLLNELKENKNATFEIIYFPELLRSLKDDFTSLDSKVRYYSEVELLLIDDIGAEKVSDWGRDEILGTILQNRMNNHLTTFFTSNLTIEELERHLSLSKGSEDAVKARRIIERIKQLADDFELITINHRN